FSRDWSSDVCSSDLSQGVYEMAPKFGVTHAQVLQAAGVDIRMSVDEAAQRLSHTDIGWAYLDQAITTPSLFALQDLRRLLIKRRSEERRVGQGCGPG